jgi:hypothetical protein
MTMIFLVFVVEGLNLCLVKFIGFCMWNTYILVWIYVSKYDNVIE